MIIRGRSQQRAPKACTPLFVTAFLGACSGGGGGSTSPAATSPVDGAPPAAAPTETSAETVDVESLVVTAATKDLVIPTKLSLLPPKSASAAALSLAPGEESDYSKQKTQTYSRAEFLQALESAEEILGFLGSTQFQDFVNKGAYIAMVANIDNGGGGGGGGEEKSSSREESMVKVVVNATQEAATKPVRADFFIHMAKDGENERIIKARAIVSAPANVKYPKGLFRVSWNMGEEGGGYIDSFAKDGTAYLTFVETNARMENGGGGAGLYKQYVRATARLDVDANGTVTAGAVMTQTDQETPQQSSSETNLAHFNSDLVLVKGSKDGTNAESCLDRNDFTYVVGRYNLYDANTGALKKLNSGFPIEVTRAGQVLQGNASYWGVSVPGGLEGVTTVNKVSFSNGQKTSTPLTLVRGPGKLWKYTANSTTLGALVGVDMNYSEDGGAGGRTDYLVQFNPNTNKIEKKSKIVRAENQPERYEDASGDAVASPWGLNVYVPSLQASLNLPVSGLTGDYVVKFFSGEMVSGTDKVPNGDLICVGQCPKMNPTWAELQNAFGGPGGSGATPYATVSVTYPGSMQAMTSNTSLKMSDVVDTFQFDAANLALTKSGTPFAMPTPPSGTSSGQGVYLRSGALIPVADYNAISDKANKDSFQAESYLSSFFRWESGSDEWSKVSVLKDGSTPVSFDKPLEFLYTHSKANDANAPASSVHYGKQFRINYGGPGQLWGIPSSGDGRDWQPKFSLANGAALGNYLVKAIEMQQSPKVTAAAACAVIPQGAAPSLPGATLPEWTPGSEPDNADLVTKVLGGVTL